MGKRCYFCGRDLSICDRIFSVKMIASQPQHINGINHIYWENILEKTNKNDEYCCGSCLYKHMPFRRLNNA